MNLKADTEYIFKTGNTISYDGTIPLKQMQEIVRCKDCKHGKPDIMCDDYTACEYRQTVMPNSGFCSYGERKDVIQK